MPPGPGLYTQESRRRTIPVSGNHALSRIQFDANVVLCATKMSATMPIRVFVPNEAGSNVKNHHDEKTLTSRYTEPRSRPCPFPSGFVIGTTAQDGCNLACYLITYLDIRTGAIIECE